MTIYMLPPISTRYFGYTVHFGSTAPVLRSLPSIEFLAENYPDLTVDDLGKMFWNDGVRVKLVEERPRFRDVAFLAIAKAP